MGGLISRGCKEKERGLIKKSWGAAASWSDMEEREREREREVSISLLFSSFFPLCRRRRCFSRLSHSPPSVFAIESFMAMKTFFRKEA
jgi:hypothetical protein